MDASVKQRVAAAAFTTNALYDTHGVDIFEIIDPANQDTQHVEWLEAPNPTLDDNNEWVWAEADALLAEHEYRRTSDWEDVGDYHQATIEPW